MKQVEFVRVKCEVKSLNVLKPKGWTFVFDHIEDVVKERIENGWSYDGFLPITIRSTGETETISLIFTKEE